jgi:hypothetical protein
MLGITEPKTQKNKIDTPSNTLSAHSVLLHDVNFIAGCSEKKGTSP